MMYNCEIVVASSNQIIVESPKHFQAKYMRESATGLTGEVVLYLHDARRPHRQAAHGSRFKVKFVRPRTVYTIWKQIVNLIPPLARHQADAVLLLPTRGRRQGLRVAPAQPPVKPRWRQAAIGSAADLGLEVEVGLLVRRDERFLLFARLDASFSFIVTSLLCLGLNYARFMLKSGLIMV